MGGETAADLFANIQLQPWLVELASNPLLLTAMCIVFDEGKRLPQDKHELYERVVATVLYSLYQDPADIDRAKRELGVIAYGWVITLPSEAEWEKAARGADGLIYPWGNDFDASKANCRDSGLGTTSAVGLFPDGRSPFKALDMSGNVWEWTRSLWGEDWMEPAHGYPYDPRDVTREDVKAPDGVRRVLRGGSFDYSAFALRAAFRSGSNPDLRLGYVGFRLVSSRFGP